MPCFRNQEVENDMGRFDDANDAWEEAMDDPDLISNEVGQQGLNMQFHKTVRSRFDAAVVASAMMIRSPMARSGSWTLLTQLGGFFAAQYNYSGFLVSVWFLDTLAARKNKLWKF